MTPAIAILLYDDGRRSPTCLGCSEILAEQGMLEVVEEYAFNPRQPEYSVIIYRVAPGFSLADCQDAVKARHVGGPWGRMQ